MTTWAFALCLVLCIGTGAAWVVDGRRRAAGIGSDLGSGMLAVLGIAAIQTSGTAFLATLLGPGVPAFQHMVRSVFVPYLVVSVFAVLLMLGAQSAGFVGSLRVRLRQPWHVAQVLLAAASLAALWWGVRLLGTVLAMQARTMVFLAPAAGAAVLTALLVVRFVSARMVGAPRPAVTPEEPDRSGSSATAAPEVVVAAPRSTVIDTTPYRRPEA